MGALKKGNKMLDWSRVGELRDEVGVEDFGEVVALFLEEVGEVITKLQDNTDRSQLEQDLHFLKGSALSLGFDTFSKLCQDGERQSAGGSADSVDIDAIVNEFTQSRDVFLAELPSRF